MNLKRSGNVDFSFVVIGDPHVGHGDSTLAEFHALQDAVNRLNPSPDLIWLTGDLGSIPHETYRRFNAPAHVVFGNWETYDDRTALRGVFSELSKDYFSFCFHDALFIGCCTAIYADHVGHFQSEFISPGQVAWLSDTLKAHVRKNQPCFIFSHNPPSSEDWPDHPLGLALTDRRFLIDLFGETRPTAMLCGHLHCWEEHELHGVPIISVPTVCSALRESPHPEILQVKVGKAPMPVEYKRCVLGIS